MLCYLCWPPLNKKVGKVMPKYDVKVKLSGNDGNAFSVMGAVKDSLKKAGASKEEIDQYLKESMSGDYDNLIRVAMDWVKVK